MKSTTKRKRGQTQDSSASDEDQPLTSAPSRKRQRKDKEPAVSPSSSEDDDLPIVTPKTKRAAKKSAAPLPEKSKAQELSEDSDEESPLFSPKSARRNRGRVIVLDDSDSDGEPRSSPVKKRRLVRRDRSSPPAEASRASDDDDDDDDNDAEMQDRPPPSTARRAVRRPRTEKEKAMEVLRRKKAGEKITLEDLTDSDEDDARPLYDSDTDSEHQALHQFDDDSEGVPEDAPAESGKSRKGKNKASKKDKKKKKKKKSSESSGDNNTSADDNLDGFVVEDGPMGIPADALAEIPLEFTRHSHKPLREHFRDVLLWLILDRIFPGFAERKHELYRIAWQKLDDEISGLAQSKFASSAWRSDFIMALRARPQFTNEQIDGESLQSCGACGRSGHPATYVPPPVNPQPPPTNPHGSYKIQFLGTPYYKGFNSPSFLHDVSPSTPCSSSSSSSPSPSGDRDEDSNPIAPATTTWAIGSVCSRNAETAHLLIHWKKALQDWAEVRLSEDGHLAPARLAERLGWKARKKNKLAQKILDEWEGKGYAKLLYKEYQAAVDKAREASTSGRGRGYGQGN